MLSIIRFLGFLGAKLHKAQSYPNLYCLYPPSKIEWPRTLEGFLNQLMADENLWYLYELHGWDEDVALAQKNKLLHLSYMRANDLRFAFDIVFCASTWYSKNGSEEAINRSSTIRAWSLAQRNCTISHRWFLISHCNKVHKNQVFKLPIHNIY